MLPDFGKMGEGFDRIEKLLERGVDALETIAASVEHSTTHPHPEATPVYEGHLDPDTGKVSGEWRP